MADLGHAWCDRLNFRSRPEAAGRAPPKAAPAPELSGHSSKRSFHESVLNAALEHAFFIFEFALAYSHVADEWHPPGAAYYVSDRLCSRSAIMVLDAWSTDRTRMTMRSRQDTAP